VADQLRLSLETYLEDLIIEQWSQIDFRADLSFVERQSKCGDIGYLDILARDKETNGFVVIELKRDQGDDETFGQLSRYMGWVAANKDQPEGVAVAGIIIAAEITPKLEAAAKTNPNVRLVEYTIRIELSPKGSVKTGDAAGDGD
jgi:RecB family endonuclease NucS